MKCLAVLIAFLVLLSPGLTAQTSSSLIEDTAWTEVRDAIAGKTTAIYYASSTEQDGPGVATTAVRRNLAWQHLRRR